MNTRSAKARFAKSAALLLAGLAVVCLGQSQEPEPSLDRDHPLLEIDLHKFGYDTSRRTGRLHKFVDFTDASHLAVAWLTLDDPADDEKIGPVKARPAHLHVLVLDARTGQRVGVHAWPTPSVPVRFLAAHDGEFLACTGNLLRLFSPSFEVIRERELPNDRACHNPIPANSRWGISPDRRSLLLFSSGQGYTMLDIETFSVTANWFDKPLIENISDHWLLATCGPSRVACIRRLHEPWRPFQPAETGKTRNDFGFSTRFVNHDTLVTGWDKKSVVTVDARQLFQIQGPKNRSFEPGATSNGGDRFALIEDRRRGPASVALDMGYLSNDRAVVYSVAQRRAIYAVKVKGDSLWTPWKSHRNQLALSPDGALLAVLDGANLKIYRLPDDNPEH